MNYLAHAYLSFDNPEILAGNLISDFVKGRKKYDYQPGILAGIDLHRAIDTFTDDHPVTKTAKIIFKPEYGLYSSAFMDVVYDHFLARELALEGNDAFGSFVKNIYRQLDNLESLLPENFRSIFPYMKKYDWLFNYQYPSGIAKSFEGLVHRAAYLSDSKPAFALFQKNYEELGVFYSQFFPLLKQFSEQKFHELLNK